MAIVRTQEEIDAVWAKAQELSFKASDAGDTDDWSEAVYKTLQWLQGNDDDPMAGVERYDEE